MKILIALSAFLLFSFSGLFAQAIDDSSWSSKNRMDRYLRRCGDILGIYFTLELRGQGYYTKLLPIVAPSNAEVVDLASLRAALPMFEINANRLNPRVYNIVDRQLAKLSSYALVSIVPDMKFSGTTFELPMALHEKIQSIATKSGFVTGSGEVSMTDTSPVKIDVENCTVRDILSSSVDLKSYSRVLWVTVTSIKQSTEVTLNFLGSKELRAKAFPQGE